MQEEISVSLMIHVEAGGEEGVEMNVWGERECVDKKQIMLGSQGVICLFLVQGELGELESKKAHPGQAAEGFPGRLNSLEFIL